MNLNGERFKMDLNSILKDFNKLRRLNATSEKQMQQMWRSVFKCNKIYLSHTFKRSQVKHSITHQEASKTVPSYRSTHKKLPVKNIGSKFYN